MTRVITENPIITRMITKNTDPPIRIYLSSTSPWHLLHITLLLNVFEDLLFEKSLFFLRAWKQSFFRWMTTELSSRLCLKTNLIFLNLCDISVLLFFRVSPKLQMRFYLYWTFWIIGDRRHSTRRRWRNRSNGSCEAAAKEGTQSEVTNNGAQSRASRMRCEEHRFRSNEGRRHLFHDQSDQQWDISTK